MTDEDLKKTYNELSDLKDEFDLKWRNNIHNLRYQTKVKENDKRVAEIIMNFVRIIRKYDFLYKLVIENEHFNYNDHKEYMEITGLWDKNEFKKYSLNVIHKLRELLHNE